MHGAHAVAQLHGVRVAAPVIGEVVATVQPVGVAGVLAPEPAHGVRAVATVVVTTAQPVGAVGTVVPEPAHGVHAVAMAHVATVQPAMAHGAVVQRIVAPLGVVALQQVHGVHVVAMAHVHGAVGALALKSAPALKRVITAHVAHQDAEEQAIPPVPQVTIVHI